MGTVEASDIDGDMMDVIKAEEQLYVKTENSEESEVGSASDVIKLEQISCDDSDYINDIGNKNDSSISSDNQKVNNELQLAPKNISACVEDSILNFVKVEETFYEENEIKPNDGNFVNMDDQQFILKEDIEIKPDEHDFNRFEENAATSQTKVNSRLWRERKYFMSHSKYRLIKPLSEETFVKKDVTTTATYLRPSDLLPTKNKKKHVSSEVKRFKCQFCSYQAAFKKHLIKHLIVHKSAEEVTMFKCESCPFQTKWKYGLKNHVLKHMDPSAVTIFNCQFCSYQTKYKELFKKHSIIHKLAAEITMFKCESCPYETKRKRDLKIHVLKHMDPSVFNCQSCSYQTKHKGHFKKHSLIHKAAAERTMFKCESCPYQTKHKGHFTKHTHTIHKAAAEITMFKCESCPYQARRKRSLKKHLLKKHIPPSELIVSTCDLGLSDKI